MSAKKKAKPGSKKKTRKKKLLAAADTSHATILAVKAAAPAIDCGRCVIRTIENHCQTTVGDLTDKLRDLCSPCDAGVMADLADELRLRCGAPANLELRCSMSVLQVISLVCGE
jgi:hypothetical protein